MVDKCKWSVDCIGFVNFSLNFSYVCVHDSTVIVRKNTVIFVFP